MNNALTKLGREPSETSKDVPHIIANICSDLEECGSSEPSRCVCKESLLTMDTISDI